MSFRTDGEQTEFVRPKPVDLAQKETIKVGFRGKEKNRVLEVKEFDAETQCLAKKVTIIHNQPARKWKKFLMKIPLINNMRDPMITDEGNRVIIEDGSKKEIENI